MSNGSLRHHEFIEMRIDVNEFSIYHIFRLIIKNFFLILLTAIVFGVGTFCYCKFYLPERFTASGSVVVTNGGIINKDTSSEQQLQNSNDKVNNADITASINLLDTVEDCLLDHPIYEQLSKELNGKYSAAQLRSFASISKRDDYSLFIDVRFEMTDRDEVVKITDMFLELTPEYIKEYVPGAQTKVTKSDGSVAKTYPNTVSSTLLAMVIGGLLAFVIAYIISLFNTTIQSEEEFKDRYNIPVLGDIPDFATAKSGKYAKSYYKGGSYYGN